MAKSRQWLLHPPGPSGSLAEDLSEPLPGRQKQKQSPVYSQPLWSRVVSAQTLNSAQLRFSILACTASKGIQHQGNRGHLGGSEANYENCKLTQGAA